jgi:hypothetical protein
MLVVFMLTMGGNSTPSAEAIVNTPTNTTGPSPTAKATVPATTPAPKSLTGIWDIVTTAPAAAGFFNCQGRLDHYASTNSFTDVKGSIQCFADLGGVLAPNGSGDPNAEPPQGSSKPEPIGNDGVLGPPPPPPYTILAPAKGFGKVDPATGDLEFRVCVPDLSTNSSLASLGPNVIAVLNLSNTDNQLNKFGKIAGAAADVTYPLTGVDLITKQGVNECNNPTAVTASPTFTNLKVELYPADSADPRCPGSVCATIPDGLGGGNWREDGAVGGSMAVSDWDGDGCTDAEELFQAKEGHKCGDDPWNPNDPVSDTTAAGIAGIYDVQVIANAQDACWGGTFSRQGAPGQFDCTGQPDGTFVPGGYFVCRANIQPDTVTVGPKNVQAIVHCYIDVKSAIALGVNTGPIAVNSNVAGAPRCNEDINGNPIAGGANPRFCGDGSPGAAPPGCSNDQSDAPAPTPVLCAQILPTNNPVGPSNCPSLPCAANRWLFAHVNNPNPAQPNLTQQANGTPTPIPNLKHTKLTGTIVNGSNTINLEGCFPDEYGGTFLKNVYVQAKIDVHTGVGLVTLRNLIGTITNCNSSSGVPTTFPIRVVRQAPNTANVNAPANQQHVTYLNYDADGDGCNDRKELGDTQTQGGMRDPENRNDFFNPEKVNTPNTQTVADIIKVVQQFNKNQGNAAYTRDTDRTGILNANSWNLGAPDGQQTVADILAAVKQFNHGCNNNP